MSAESVPNKCPLCGSDKLEKRGQTVLPKYEGNFKSVNWDQTLTPLIFVCQQCGYVVLFA